MRLPYLEELREVIALLKEQNNLLRNLNQTLYTSKAIQVDTLNAITKVDETLREEV